MLNKELLMAGASKAQKEVRLTVGYSEVLEAYGMRYSAYAGSFDVGGINILPYWNTSFLAGILEDELRRMLYVSLSAPIPNFSLCVKNSRGSNQLTWPSGDSQTAEAQSALALRDDVNAEIILTFDPPPRRLSGSRDTRTNLRRGYYVEKVSWEAQDAEQGTSSDGRRRGVVDSTMQVHRGLLFRPNPTGLKQSNPLEWTSKHRYCGGSSASKEYPDTLRDCWNSRHSKSRWVPSGRRQARRKHHIATKRCVSRAIHRSVAYEEALYA